MSSSVGEKKHTCVLCNTLLKSKEELQQHFRKHANKEIDNKGRVIPRPGHNHLCVLCNSALKSKEELQEHFRKHANKEIDNKGRSWKTQLTQASASCNASSVKTESGGIVCDVCNQEFETVTIAIQHKFRKHPESATKHFCPFCGMQFPLKANRDMHLADKHGSSEMIPGKIFPCSDCGVVFYNQEAQIYHNKSTHRRIVALFKPVATPPPSKKIRLNNAGEAQSVYYCHICGFEYIVKFNLQKHLERQHSEEERSCVPDDMLKCITCDALFYNKRAYDNHNMYHKPGDLYVTSEAQRLQTVTRVDQDFDIRRVQTAAEKFIPVVRPQRPKQSTHKKRKKTAEEPNSNDDMSPDSGEGSSDSDSEVPLVHRLATNKRHHE